jgi:hypothetical protein
MLTGIGGSFITFAGMRKYFLFISTLFCFLAAVAGTGNCNARKTFSSISSIEGNLYSPLSVSYPHTELEVNSHSASINSIGRQQSLQSFTPTAEFPDCYFPFSILYIKENASNLSFKQYLFHIYPSHNFW